MPRRDDISKILIVGSGPIVIGQAAEFDYSGAQACKVLREEGYEIVLVNSNPATIMTDPEYADRTYIEPLLVDSVTEVIERERPDALLPTLGGQTALNLAKDLSDAGVLGEFGVSLIGADYDAIERAEDRELFRKTMIAAGIRVPRSTTVSSLSEAREAVSDMGLPVVVRPAFTLGGFGGSIVGAPDEFERSILEGLKASPIGQILLEECVIGWGEFELEVMRDRKDNVVIVCSIENIDPMGVHTGDSVTVAPAQTLSDTRYQVLRDLAIDVIRAVGVETGGSNVQFAVDPATGETVVIEMNPRVSRSSALASKATGFPIAKIAARLAVGYALDEIENDITKKTPASFEPTIDYVVVKAPRFAFEKFRGADRELTTHMKSVGEVMAIGRTFKQAFTKALRSRELDTPPDLGATTEELLVDIETPTDDRYDKIIEAFSRGVSIEDVHARTSIDPWFLGEFKEMARLGDGTESDRAGLALTFKAVDTCAAEFEAQTPYYYSSLERAGTGASLDAGEVRRGSKPSVVILGSGPNRIGQGIEFDYCCVHAAMTVRETGRDAVMINCNPETVSTDYDTSDRLYFEPLTVEDVLAVCRVERPEGVIVQFGGQTPLRIAADLARAGVPLLGTDQESIDLAEDRRRFGDLLKRLGIEHPSFATATSAAEAERRALEVGFPLLVRPSYVLGGRAMEICYGPDDLATYLDTYVRADPDHPLLLDRFLEYAVEVDVDALADGREVFLAGIMQHVEEAGIHSGDSACVLPPVSLGEGVLAKIAEYTRQIASALNVIGLLNVQYAVKGDRVYVIEANPRASRTVPFVSKATGFPLAKLACRVMLGEKIADMGLPARFEPEHVSVKEAVLPFGRFTGADSLLGPEMKSTGEVMGMAEDFPRAFGKAQAAAGVSLPSGGGVFISVNDRDKAAASGVAARLYTLGFRLLATSGTARTLKRMGIEVTTLKKIGTGSPNVLDFVAQGDVKMVVNTPAGRGARADGWEIRRTAVEHNLPCITSMAGAEAAVSAIEAARRRRPGVVCLQDLHNKPDEAPQPPARAVGGGPTAKS